MIDEKGVNEHFPASIPSLPVSIDLKYRPDIDGLRAIAVSAVVIFHAFPSVLTGGFVGVDIFFVISGYLISSIIYKDLHVGSFSFAHFYARRVRRIFPSLIVVLVTSYVLGRHTLFALEYKNLGAHIAAASVFVSNFLLTEESGYFDGDSDLKVLLHLWSLAIEEQFYIVWPVLVYVLWTTKRLFAMTTVGLTLLSFTLNLSIVKHHAIQTFYWPMTRVWELLIGACLAFILISMKDRFTKAKTRLESPFIVPVYGEMPVSNGSLLWNTTSMVGTFLILLPVVFLTKTSIFPGWWALSPTFGTTLVILSGPTAWINQKVLSSCLLVRIGLISYPLYLWHWPLLVFTRIVHGQETSSNVCIAIVLLSIILAWMTYVFIDKPLRFGSFATIKVVLLCVSMIIIGLMGYHTYQSDSLRSQFPPEIQDIVNFKYNTSKLYRGRTCFLLTEQDESQFGACVDNSKKPASTAVILWGDSYAAHLHPGITTVKSDLRLTQLAASHCPPIIGYLVPIRPFCKQINDYVAKRISNEKPNTVILAALWTSFVDWKNLTRTITYLKNASINNIYLIGPLPLWESSLPRTLYRYYIYNKQYPLPKYLRFGLAPNTDKLDNAMLTFATDVNINYISPYKILCTVAGCLTRTGDSVDTLVAWDNGHLTVAGSTFVVSHFPRTLLHSR